MAGTVTWDELRDLAGFAAREGLAISLYLDLDPSLAPTAAELETRLNSLLDEGGKQAGAFEGELSHDQRLALRADFDRIRTWCDLEFERDGARGLAIFCAGLDELWRPLPLTETVPDRIALGEQLSLAPLAPLVGRGEGALVVMVSREQGRIYRLEAGRLVDVADHFDEQLRRHDQGGWAQARMQRHVDEQALEHLRRVAGEVDRLVRAAGRPPLVVFAADDIWAEFGELLSQETRGALAGVAHAEAHASPAELLDSAGPVLERWREEREGEIVERWRAEAGRNGRASAGWEETLAAASDARIETLLFQEGADRPVRRCPQCGRLAVDDDRCPLDGAAMTESGEGLDLLVHMTLGHGGTSWAVRHRQDLDPVGGVGALLRF
jgi:peptide chain release factor subunit 1